MARHTPRRPQRPRSAALATVIGWVLVALVTACGVDQPAETRSGDEPSTAPASTPGAADPITLDDGAAPAASAKGSMPPAGPAMPLISSDPWTGGPAVGATVLHTDGNLDAYADWPGPGIPADGGLAPAWQVPRLNEFAGTLHLLVLEERDGWLRVQIPVRPNGTEAWVARHEVELRPIEHRVEIDLDARRLRVLQGDAVVFDETVAIGRPSAPTPVGRFYLRDAFAWDPTSVYGPYVLPLSAYSEAIDAINGGEAVTAIHGTNRPDRLGDAASLGCIRLDNEAVTTLAHLIQPGTPVTIRSGGP